MMHRDLATILLLTAAPTCISPRSPRSLAPEFIIHEGTCVHVFYSNDSSMGFCLNYRGWRHKSLYDFDEMPHKNRSTETCMTHRKVNQLNPSFPWNKRIWLVNFLMFNALCRDLCFRFKIITNYIRDRT